MSESETRYLNYYLYLYNITERIRYVPISEQFKNGLTDSVSLSLTESVVPKTMTYIYILNDNPKKKAMETRGIPKLVDCT